MAAATGGDPGGDPARPDRRRGSRVGGPRTRVGRHRRRPAERPAGPPRAGRGRRGARPVAAGRRHRDRSAAPGGGRRVVPGGGCLPRAGIPAGLPRRLAAVHRLGRRERVSQPARAGGGGRRLRDRGGRRAEAERDVPVCAGDADPLGVLDQPGARRRRPGAAGSVGAGAPRVGRDPPDPPHPAGAAGAAAAGRRPGSGGLARIGGGRLAGGGGRPPRHCPVADGVRRRVPPLRTGRADGGGRDAASRRRPARTRAQQQDRPGGQGSGGGVAVRAGPGDLPALRVGAVDRTAARRRHRPGGEATGGGAAGAAPAGRPRPRRRARHHGRP
jgi:hypothetical protein